MSVSTMTYDPAKNRIASAVIFGQNRTYAYDARGNVTDNGPRTFVYDPGSVSGACFANQPVSATGSGLNAAWSYDGSFGTPVHLHPEERSVTKGEGERAPQDEERVKEVKNGKTVYTLYSRVTGGLVYRDEVTDNRRTDYASAGGAALRLTETGSGAAVPTYTTSTTSAAPSRRRRRPAA